MNNPHEVWEPAPQPPPPGGGYPPVGPPHSRPVNGQQWVPPPLPSPRRPQRSPIVFVVVVAIAVVAAVIITIVLTRDSDPASNASFRPAGPVASTTPTQPKPERPFDNSEPPRPTASVGAPPTGVEYGRDQRPAPGECVDTSRNSNKGVVLYRADCNDPTTPLVLDRTVPGSQKCEPHGYYSIRGFDERVMCFTWQVQEGDCLDLKGPRKAPCKAGGPPDYGTVTVTGLHVGGTDGTGCPDPNRWLQAGHGSTRGVACFMPTGMTESGIPAPSTR